MIIAYKRQLPKRIKLLVNEFFAQHSFMRLLAALILVFAAIFVSPKTGHASLTVQNTSTYVGSGRWNWTIYIDADVSTVNNIRCVEYTLHPTFPNPVRTVCDEQQTKFALSANGWGTFTVQVRISYKDGGTQAVTHRLVFEEQRVEAPLRITTQNSAREIESGWWEWGIYVDGSPDELHKINCVEYTLHRSFPNPVRMVCSPANKFKLTARGWGTFTIPVRVLLKNGSIQRLTHRLRFQ